jgi:hypothetical protein
MFDHEGVLNVQHALRSRKTPPLLAAFFVVIVSFVFGNKGCLALVATALLTNLMVVQLRKVRHAKQNK